MTSFSDRLIYVLLALLALFSWWLVQYTDIAELIKPKKAAKSPDFFSKGYRKWEMDEAGKLKSRLTAVELTHFTEYWATHTKKPVIEFIYENKPPWIIESETGVLSQDGKKLLLNGKVMIQRPEAPGFRQIIVNTSNLKVNPETSYAETEAWSELISPPNITTGKGMKAVFKEPVHLELLANVKGKYETKNNKSLLICFVFLLAGFCPLVQALESDADQPITIDSNTATYDDVTATSTYTGNVISLQGSIRVNSDKLVVYFVNGDAEKLVFTGNKAKFKQTPNPGAQDITGEALTGEYYPKKNLLILINQATVWQGNATYTSDLIEYDSKRSVVKAGEKSSDSKRVHVLIKPKQPSGSNTQSGDNNDNASGKAANKNIQ